MKHSPSLGELYDRMSESDRKILFFFALGIIDFYADVWTWVAVTLMPDHPCGNIVHDFRADAMGVRRPGGRARLAEAWIASKFKRMLKDNEE